MSRATPQSAHRVATAAFWCIFHHDGKISPGWKGWGVHAHPLSLQLPSRTNLQCTLQLNGQIHSSCFISNKICTLCTIQHRRAKTAARTGGGETTRSTRATARWQRWHRHSMLIEKMENYNPSGQRRRPAVASGGGGGGHRANQSNGRLGQQESKGCLRERESMHCHAVT